jgi:hypothetical protein
MQINKLYIKIILFLNFIHILFGAIQDPVARHDLSECATYLCPTFRNMAEDYLGSGCVGEFKDYFKANYIEVNLMESETNKVETINLSTLLFLMTLSTFISLYIGYTFSQKEKEDERKYFMKEIE